MNDLAIVGQLSVRDKEFSSLQSLQHYFYSLVHLFKKKLLLQNTGTYIKLSNITSTFRTSEISAVFDVKQIV